MKILLAGATGFIGKELLNELPAGWSARLLSRSPEKTKEFLALNFSGRDFEAFSWDGSSPLPPEAFENIEAVVNLVGENIAAKRWSLSQKEIILNSRLNATRALVSGVEAHGSAINSFISASALGRYPVNKNSLLDESSAAGTHFLARVCRLWEEELLALPSSVRTTILRIGLVLGKKGGALAKILPLFKWGLGGKIGTGEQLMNWIHVADLTGFIIHALRDESINGPYNCLAPNPVTNKDFTQILATLLKRPALIHSPGIFVKLALGEMSTLVLDNQLVDGSKILQSGHQFKYPGLEQALAQILKSEK